MTSKKIKDVAKKPDTATGHKNQLRIKDEQGKSRTRQIAEIGLSATSLNTVTACTFSKGMIGEIDLGESISVMREKASKVNAGNISELEATLTAQAVSLDAIFNELARRAALNMGEYLQATESYMRLALKAQAQCARTIEVLVTMKNPPVVFVKQANIANGPQQVNNGSAGLHTSTHAPAGNSSNQSNELLELQHEQRLDNRAPGTAGAINPPLETVGAIRRAKD